jgi:signal transduction histidine kinase
MAGKVGRSWTDAFLGRPGLLVAAVALFVALPILALGQASENDSRARLAAAQVDSAKHAADAVSTSFNDRTALIGKTLDALSELPRPDRSPIGLAVQRGEVDTLRALADSVELLYPRSVLRTFIAVLDPAQSHDAPFSSARATIVAASPPGTGLVGLALSDPTVRFGTFPQLRPTLTCLSVSDAYPGTIDAPSRIVLDVPSPQGCETFFGTAVLEAEIDVARTFAESAAPFLADADDAYLLSGRGQLIGRAHGPTAFPLRDLSGDPFVQLLGAGPVARADASDPLGGGTRLIASARLSGSNWQILVLRDTSAVDREIDSVLRQLAAARYLLVALLLVGALVIARAASTTLRQRRALAVANDRVEAASLHKSAFLANMSHELRTPLNSINGFSDVLLTGIGGPLTEKQREYLADIRGSGDHLLALINDVLDLSKVEAGRMELHPTEFDLRETVEGAYRSVAPLAQQKGQRLTLGGDGGGVVRLDQGRFRQVLLNVLSNAVKYTPDGGSVMTTVGREDGVVRIAVRDTGVGIAPEDQARVFDDFARIESGYAKTQQGTGLGLALARRLARLMGGDITLASSPGEGSTFTITVPAA